MDKYLDTIGNSTYEEELMFLLDTRQALIEEEEERLQAVLNLVGGKLPVSA